MKSRSLAKNRARKRKGCPANEARRQKKRQSMMATTASNSQEQEPCTSTTPSETSSKETIFKPLKNMSAEKLRRPSSISSSSSTSRHTIANHRTAIKSAARRRFSLPRNEINIAPAIGNSIMNLSCLNAALWWSSKRKKEKN